LKESVRIGNGIPRLLVMLHDFMIEYNPIIDGSPLNTEYALKRLVLYPLLNRPLFEF
jgi:hypothetical protein